VVIGVSLICYAEDTPPDQSLERRFIERNIEISEWFDRMADGLDLFLVGRRITNQKNQTRVQFENDSYTQEATAFKDTVSIGIYPRFPNLEKYWALKFTSYDEKEESRNETSNYFNPSSRRQNYGATVAWYRHFGRIKTSFEPRVELQSPIRISHSLAFESVANFEKFEFNPKVEFYASARRGVGTAQKLNWNFFLTKKYNLTFINEGDYVDRDRTYSVGNGVALGQIISRRTNFSYGFNVYSNNRSNYHLDSYVTSVSWNELVYRKIFDYTITPYMQFSKGDHFRRRFGMIANLRLNF
jgi:hypothetical protein